MRRINAANATGDNKFQDANPGTGQKATSFNAAWCNDVQESLMFPITESGAAGSAAPEQFFRAMINLIYRVGDYINTESGTAPGTRFPWQTWVAVTGRVLVGLDVAQPEFDVVGEEGGAKTHTLSAAESPYGQSSDGVGHDGSLESDRAVVTRAAAPHNNLQPYRVVRMWRRTA